MRSKAWLITFLEIMLLGAVTLSAQVLVAQVLVTVSPKGRQYDRIVLGKRLSKTVMAWSVELASNDSAQVAISESAIRRGLPQLRTYNHEDMALLIEDATKNSGWSRGARIAGDIGQATALAIAFKGIRVKETWPPIVLNATPIVIEYVVARLSGQAVPILRNFERLAWTQPKQIDPGGNESAIIFSYAWKDPQDQSFVIETAKSQLRRSVQ